MCESRTHMHVSMYSVLRSAAAPSSKPDKSLMILSLSETAVCRLHMQRNQEPLKVSSGHLQRLVWWFTREGTMTDNRAGVYNALLHIYIFHRLWQTNAKAQHSTNIWFLHGSAPNPKLNCNTAHILSGKNNQRIEQKNISNLRTFRE